MTDAYQRREGQTALVSNVSRPPNQSHSSRLPGVPNRTSSSRVIQHTCKRATISLGYGSGRRENYVNTNVRVIGLAHEKIWNTKKSRQDTIPQSCDRIEQEICKFPMANDNFYLSWPMITLNNDNVASCVADDKVIKLYAIFRLYSACPVCYHSCHFSADTDRVAL